MTPSLPAPMEVLPHRPPFLFIDRCLVCTDTLVEAERTFPPDEPFFAGHFPGMPIVPGVILIEALAQTLGYLAMRRHPEHTILLTGVDACRIRRPVRPGETVHLRVEVDRVKLRLVVAHGKVTVDGETVLTAKIKGYLGDKLPNH